MSAPQLPLRFALPPFQRFDSFEAGENAEALAAVRVLGSEPIAGSMFLSGPEGSGKTHLLVAASREAQGALFLPLQALGEAADEALLGRGAEPLVAVDDVHLIAGRRAAEIALFDLYNRCRDHGGRLLLSARAAPQRLPLVLPDLASRLASSVQFTLAPLDEDARRAVLQRRAAERGLTLEPDVIEFLFRRHARDLGALTTLLDHIDRESLAQQRRITLPFVRRLIGLPARDT
jgi:DnaA family protein